MPEHCICRVKITFELLLTICFVSAKTNLMKYLVNWIPLNTHDRFEQNPTLPCTKQTNKPKKIGRVIGYFGGKFWTGK